MEETRSSSVIEIIHTDICGPFNVTSVDVFNSFITFTNDSPAMGIFIPYMSDLKYLINLRYLRLK
jgi:hypothetical protein